MASVEDLEGLALAALPGGVVPGYDLPPAGDAGLDGEHEVAGVAVLPGLLLRDGPGADHRELPLEHVGELGQLVQGGPAQEAAHAGDPGVAVDLLLAPPLGELGLGEVALGVLVGVGVHGAQLVDVKRFAVLPDAPLPEDRGARALQADGQAGGGHGDRQHEADARGEDQVEGPLDREVAPTPRRGGRDGVVGRRHVVGAAGDGDGPLRKAIFGYISFVY